MNVRTLFLRRAILRPLGLVCGCVLVISAFVSASSPHPQSPAQETELIHIGLGSCLHQDRPQPILDAVLDERFDLFLFLGDNVYGDARAPNDLAPDDLALLRAAYDKQARSEGLRRLRQATPTLAVWDDHDYGINDGGADFAGRLESEKIFEAFWKISASQAQSRRPGVYDSVLFGPPGRRVQIVLLDTRFFRSPLLGSDEPGTPGKERYIPDPDPAKTMLGESQWKWLELELAKPADLRLLVSSIQVIAEGHGWEAWRTLPQERQRLYETIRRAGAEGVVVLSGDRHRAGIYRRDDALDYPLYELTSSSLNLPIEGTDEEPGPYRLGPTYRLDNYGAVEIDWARERVDLIVKDVRGEPVLEQSVSLGAIRPSGTSD